LRSCSGYEPDTSLPKLESGRLELGILEVA